MIPPNRFRHRNLGSISSVTVIETYESNRGLVLESLVLGAQDIKVYLSYQTLSYLPRL